MSFTSGDTGHVTEHNRVLGVINSLPVFAVIEWNGSGNAVARGPRSTVISQNTSPAVVINAALTAAGADANGGAVMLPCISTPVDTPIVGAARTALVGHAGFNRTTNTPWGAVLKSNGLGSTDSVVASGGSGFYLDGVAVHGNNQAGKGFSHLSGGDVTIRNSVLCYAITNNLYHAPSAGSYAFNLRDSIIWHSDVNVNIASGTDGRIENCSIFEGLTQNVHLGAGGWVLSGCHITHSSALTTQVNVEITGSTCIVTGNYFDSCKNGPTVRIAGSGIVFTGNRVYNDSGNNGGTLAIALDNAYGSTIVGNHTHTNAGTGMQWRLGTWPTASGCYGPNYHLNSSKGFVDSANTAVPVATTATSYVGPNPAG